MSQKSISFVDTIPLLAWLLLGLLSLTWGSSFILMKKGLIAFSPQQLAGLRISLSFIAFIPVFLWNIKKVDWSKWQALLTVGLAGSFLPAFLYATAQTELSSSVTGVLSALTPLFTLILGITFFKFSSSKGKIIGIVIGFIGASFLVLPNDSSGETNNLFFALLTVIATFLYGLTNNVLKAKLQDMNSVAVSATSFMFIGIPALILLFTTDFINVVTTHEYGWESFIYVCILSLLGTVMATLLYFKLIQITNPIFGSMVSYLVPMVALFWGFVDGEMIFFLQIVGMILILIGIYISRK